MCWCGQVLSAAVLTAQEPAQSFSGLGRLAPCFCAAAAARPVQSSTESQGTGLMALIPLYQSVRQCGIITLLPAILFLSPLLSLSCSPSLSLSFSHSLFFSLSLPRSASHVLSLLFSLLVLSVSHLFYTSLTLPTPFSYLSLQSCVQPYCGVVCCARSHN